MLCLEFCAFVRKMCPKVIASLLYVILAYKRFHSSALLSDSGGLVGDLCIIKDGKIGK